MREMKDSGIEWIGNIPANWKRCKIKNVVSIIGSGTTPTSSNMDYYNDEDVNWIQSGDLYKNTYIKNTSVLLSEKALNIGALQLYYAPFIVIAMYGASVGNISISLIDACTNQACCVIKSNANNDLKFLFYWLSMCKTDFLGQSVGGGQPNISQSRIKNQFYYEPSKEEQQRIASFLDSKCSELDALSADIQKEIEILEKYKRSVITEAVTKGMNPDVEMKDSGIEWVGKIPEHWNLKKGKYLFKQQNYRGNSICLQLLSPSQKYGVIPQNLLEELTTQNVVKVSTNTDLRLFKTVHVGDFCISLRSFQGGFEYSDYEGVVSPAYQIFKAKSRNIYNGYSRYMFKDKGFIDKMNSYTMTLRDGKNISFKDFGNTYLPVPPLAEQKEITGFLDSKCKEIEYVITDKKRQLEVLDSYRKSLIYEYVTGKKEVK